MKAVKRFNGNSESLNNSNTPDQFLQASLRSAPKERTFLSVLRPARASLTLEAAVIIPLFLGLIAALLYMLGLIGLQSEIQLKTEEVARDIGKRAYAAEGSDILSALNTNPLTLKAEIIDDSLRRRLDNSQVRGGTGGVHTLMSSFDEESGILDVAVVYRYDVPFLSGIISAPFFCQHCRCRVWTGEEISGKEAASGSEENDEEIVYITPTGTAYHSSTGCPYLDLSVRSVSFAAVDFLRNANGGIYYRCTACAKGADPQTVYVTEYGTNWHASLSCSGLKRTVTAVKLSEAAGRHPCPKCYGEH